MKNLLVLILASFIPLSVFSQVGEILYQFPKPGSSQLTPESSVLLKVNSPEFAKVIGHHEHLIVTNENGKKMTGKYTIVRDGKTITFKPDQAFMSGEKISVSLLVNGENKTPDWTFQVKKPLAFDKLNQYKEWILNNPEFRQFNDFQTAAGLSKRSGGDPVPVTLDSVKNPAPGEFLFANNFPIDGYGDYMYVMKNDGSLHKTVPIPGERLTNFKPLDNGLFTYGNIYRSHWFTGGGAVRYEMIDNEFNVLNTFEAADGYEADNHDFVLLPNGNQLFIIYEPQIEDLSSVVPGGNPGCLVVNSIVQELDSDRNVVFMWRSLDYIPVTDSYVDLSAQIADYAHFNALDVSPDGHILVTARTTSELIKIHRETGDIIWRLGGKNNQFTFINDHDQYAPFYFSYPHDGHYLENGNIMLFDNGGQRPQKFSRAVEYSIDEQNRTATNVWAYRNTPDVFGANQGNAQRLKNGNTVICWGSANLSKKSPVGTEVNMAGEIQAEINGPIGFRGYRVYKADFITPQPPVSVTINDVVTGITYNFTDETSTTGVSIRLNSASFDYNFITVEKEEKSAVEPGIFDVYNPVVKPVRIWIFQDGISAFSSEIYCKMADFGITDPENWMVAHRTTRGNGLFLPVATTYQSGQGTLKVNSSSFGEYIFYKPTDLNLLQTPVTEFPRQFMAVLADAPLRLRWATRGIVEFSHLQVSADDQFSSLLVNDSTIRETSYVMDPQVDGTQLFWRVRLLNSTRRTTWSETASFTATGAFYSLQAPNGGEQWEKGKSYFISWKTNLTDSVTITLRDLQTNALIPVVDSLVNTGSYQWLVPADLQTGGSYRVLVQSIDQPEIMDSSDVPFSILSGVGVGDERNPLSEFRINRVYPNPFNPSTMVDFTMDKPGTIQAEVVDVLGRVMDRWNQTVTTAGTTSMRIQADRWAGGVYILRLTSGNQTITARMVYVH